MKLALSPGALEAMSTALKGFGSGAGMGGLVGAGAGALYGAGKGYSKARGEGASVGQAIGGGLSGLGSGALKGALIGAGAGGVVGAVRPGMAAALAERGGLRGASNFGQRQVHSLTGVGDAPYARSIGAGAADAEHRLNEAREAWHGSIGTPAQRGTRDELAAAKKHFGTAAANEARGMSSIPGYLKSMAKDPMGTLREGAREQWQSGGGKIRALMYGTAAATTANELRQKGDIEGEGRFERTGKALGMVAPSLVAPLPIIGDAALGGTVSSGLGRLGRRLDRSVARRPPPNAVSAPDPAGGATQASEHVVSDRASGAIPESLS